MMDDTIKEARRQSQRYWYVDGLTEIGASVLILLLGLIYLAIGLLGNSPAGEWLSGIGEPGTLLIGYFIVNAVIRQLKRRVTYPRSGYVAYRQPKGKIRVIQLIFVMILAAGAAYMASTLGINFGQNTLQALLGLVLGAAIAYLGYDYGLQRFYWLAGFTLLAGVISAVLGLNDNYTMALFFGVCALGWLASGGNTLIQYLRQTTPERRQEP
jgi:hypothetical protein